MESLWFCKANFIYQICKNYDLDRYDKMDCSIYRVLLI